MEIELSEYVDDIFGKSRLSHWQKEDNTYTYKIDRSLKFILGNETPMNIDRLSEIEYIIYYNTREYGRGILIHISRVGYYPKPDKDDILGSSDIQIAYIVNEGKISYGDLNAITRIKKQIREKRLHFGNNEWK
jgi:hypothetical protein